jgi:hypothetical protein
MSTTRMTTHITTHHFHVDSAMCPTSALERKLHNTKRGLIMSARTAIRDTIAGKILHSTVDKSGVRLSVLDAIGLERYGISIVTGIGDI